MKFLLVTLPILSLMASGTPLSGDLRMGAIPTVSQEVIVGKAEATDGDSLRIKDKRIRIFGIDAVETSQLCTVDGAVWKCGRASRMALERLVKGKMLICDVRDMDRGRFVSVCHADGVDIGREQVRRGWAVAYTQFSREYVSVEAEARAADRGLWRSQFERPHDYRARLRREAEQSRVVQPPPSTDCNIKGNISRSGARIFHIPGQADYARTSINEDRGEQWFCTAESAREAGWRAAKR